MTDEDIIELFKTNRYRIAPYILKQYENKEGKFFNSQTYDYIMTRYSDSDSFRESLCRIIFHVEVHPKCPVCHSRIPFKYDLGYKIFNDCCCQKCTNIYLNRIGKLNTKESIEKANNSRKKTLKERYGVINTFQIKEVKEKIKEKVQKKWNVPLYSKTENFKKFMQENKEIINERRDATKRKNHTFNTSKPEENLYILLKEKFPEVVRQYKDKNLYPWNCDFFIPSINLYIEYQGYYTHGKHPYHIDSIEDNKLIQEYKKRYGEKCQAITIWSISDVKKRETAKKNHLHWIEFFTYDEEKIMDEIERYIEDINNGFEGIRTVL